ncbi:MAG: nuclear transport factor 2 family protein [Pirellulales bacterium]
MRTKQLFVLSMILFSLAAVCFAGANDSPTDEFKAVEQANAEFYKGLNAMFTGDTAAMQQIWSHADDVTYLGPAGDFLVGWDAVRDAWESQAALKLGGEVEPVEMHTTVGNDLAFTQCYEKGTNLDPQGRTVKVSIRATNVFRKERGEWKMIGHHTDLLPFLTKQRSIE